jgi:hypothetical protein
LEKPAAPIFSLEVYAAQRKMEQIEKGGMWNRITSSSVEQLIVKGMVFKMLKPWTFLGL